MTGQFMQANRKKRRLHLAGQDRAQTSTRSFITQDPDQIFAVVGRGTERQPLNVIPMRVCDEKSQLDRSRSQLLFQRQPEGTNRGARVDQNNLTAPPPRAPGASRARPTTLSEAARNRVPREKSSLVVAPESALGVGRLTRAALPRESASAESRARRLRARSRDRPHNHVPTPR